jgi:hypothetical protein
MKIICATHSLDGPGGTETYVVTLASHLERLGHDVHIYAREQGRMAELARESGLRVARTLGELPETCDGIISNFTEVAYDLSSRYSDAAQAYVCHSAYFHLQLPPQVAGGPQVLVALNDRVEALLAGLANPRPIVRLRQPVDIIRFCPVVPLSATPRRLLLFGNYAEGERRALVEDVCQELGIAVTAAGVTSEPTELPEEVINDADIVMGYGRCIVEAMACGRAAYVYDRHGGDGWVTPDSYVGFEADGFAGQASPGVVTREQLREDLLAYSPEMGLYNRDLAVTHHQAPMHAAAVVEALSSDVGASPVQTAEAPWRELARLTRVLSDQEFRVMGVNRRLSAMYTQADELHAAVKRATQAQAAAEEELTRLRAVMTEDRHTFEQREAELTRRAEEIERHAAAAEQRLRLIGDFRATRRYRMAVTIGRPLDRLRAWRKPAPAADTDR